MNNNRSKIIIKRIYELPEEADGYRMLVDRLWPRGLTKQAAHLDEWNKEISPSADLRKWFDHRAERFEAFKLQYREELLLKQEELSRLREIAAAEGLCLLYAAKSSRINHAQVLWAILENRAL